MNRKMTVGAAFALVAAAFAAGAAAQEVSISVRDLAKNPDAYVGKKVVFSDCMMQTYVSIIGAQCSVSPLDATILVYVDSDTLTDAGKKIGNDCDTLDIKNKCLLKVSGEVTKNGRGQAVIKKATMEVIGRVPAA